MALKWDLPESAQNSIVKFLSLPVNKIEKFFEILINEKKTNQKEIEALVSAECSLPTENCEDVVRFVVSFIMTSDRGNETQEIIRALSELKIIKENKQSLDSLPMLSANLEKLLTSGSTFTAKAKSTSLLFSREHILRSTRIFTDLRPIFTTKAKDKIQAFLLMHNLKITYSSGKEQQDLFLALDADDIIALKKQLDDAIVKSKTLTKDFSSKGLEVWED